MITVTGNVEAGDGSPVYGTITCTPSATPVWVSKSSVWWEMTEPYPQAQVDNTGAWSLTLPWPSESKPSALMWTITDPTGTKWKGTLPDTPTSTVTLRALIDTYTWQQQ